MSDPGRALPSTETIIRPLEKQDRAAIVHLLRATHRFSKVEIAIAQELIDIILNNPAQKDYYAFVQEVQDEPLRPAGFLLLGPTPATAGTWHLYWIAVDPDYQGTGLAQALDRHAESFLRERGGYWLIAETSSQPGYERTRAFYRKQGYAELARIADYYKPSDDLILFGKRF